MAFGLSERPPATRAGMSFDVKAIGLLAACAFGLLALDRVNRLLGLDSKVLDIGGEQNLTTWFSSVQFAAAAVAAGGVVGVGAAPVGVWGPIAAVMGLFSIDEVVMLHERVEIKGGHWIIDVLEPLVALALVVISVHILRHLARRERRLLVAAATTLLGAQVVSAANGSGLPPALGNGLSALEEIIEMLTGSLVLVAALPLTLEGLRRRRGEGGPGSAEIPQGFALADSHSGGGSSAASRSAAERVQRSRLSG